AGGTCLKCWWFHPAALSFVSAVGGGALLPWEPFGGGWWKGALELGLEGWLQYYVQPKGEYALGLKAAVRYHFIGLGRFVPYLEFLAGVGATDLAVKEIDSRWTFVLEGRAGL